jgi:predicted metal-binding membrane protein
MASEVFQGGAAAFVLFASGWTLMTVAMMLPTSFPLLSRFQIMIHDRKYRSLLLAICIGGYLISWMLFGVLAHIGVSQLYSVVDGVQFEAALLIVAGLYQFTPLKHYCLQKCRSPMSFIVSHWHGRNEARESFWLGAHHGIFCIGCCWSLMLLMFLAVSVHLIWMLVLGTIMAIEKNVSWGKRISGPIGLVLIIGGLLLTTA